jgi:hypothetical protein
MLGFCKTIFLNTQIPVILHCANGANEAQMVQMLLKTANVNEFTKLRKWMRSVLFFVPAIPSLGDKVSQGLKL